VPRILLLLLQLVLAALKFGARNDLVIDAGDDVLDDRVAGDTGGRQED
jgi:hypothetical protein